MLAGLVSLGTSAAAAELSERQKIEALLDSMKSIPGASFVRNGTDYTADQAVDHLKRKLTAAGPRVKAIGAEARPPPCQREMFVV